MATAVERHRNQVKAGIFVTVAIVLIVTVLIVLNDITQMLQSTRIYTITFPVSSGVHNLTTGSKVLVGGLQMGRVTDVRPVLPEGSEVFDTIEVEMELDAKVMLFDNAIALIGAPLLGAEAWINIPSVGDPATGSAIAPGERIEGATSPGFLATVLGEANASRADEVIANLHAFSDFLASIDSEYESRIVPMLDDLNASSTDVRALVSRIQEEDWPRWVEIVNSVLARADTIAEHMDLAVSDGRDLIAHAGSSVTRVNEAIDRNRPGLDEFVDRLNRAGADVEEIITRVKDETIDKVNALIDRGQEGIDAFASVGTKLDQEFSGMASELHATVANARLASEQLKLTTIEVRRSPWKLLYQPGAEEYEHELLYEAARSFAVAASDLKAASESVDRLLTHHGDRLQDDSETMQRLRENLIASFERYEQAQQRLLDVLVADPR